MLGQQEKCMMKQPRQANNGNGKQVNKCLQQFTKNCCTKPRSGSKRDGASLTERACCLIQIPVRQVKCQFPQFEIVWQRQIKFSKIESEALDPPRFTIRIHFFSLCLGRIVSLNRNLLLTRQPVNQNSPWPWPKKNGKRNWPTNHRVHMRNLPLFCRDFCGNYCELMPENGSKSIGKLRINPIFAHRKNQVTLKV